MCCACRAARITDRSHRPHRSAPIRGWAPGVIGSESVRAHPVGLRPVDGHRQFTAATARGRRAKEPPCRDDAPFRSPTSDFQS
ncbi:hypothetical protein [Lysobacter gummosus]|uniref:hypothetical protein n=1 Tax=Lysobacter gummosus TaxID=262324 RepID=UPI00363AA9FB